MRSLDTEIRIDIPFGKILLTRLPVLIFIIQTQGESDVLRRMALNRSGEVTQHGVSEKMPRSVEACYQHKKRTLSIRCEQLHKVSSQQFRVAILVDTI